MRIDNNEKLNYKFSQNLIKGTLKEIFKKNCYNPLQFFINQ